MEPRERGLRAVLGEGRRAHGYRRVGQPLTGRLPDGAADFIWHIGSEKHVPYTEGSVPHLLPAHLLESLPAQFHRYAAAKAGLLDEILVGVGGNAEPAGHTKAALHHLRERGRLAAADSAAFRCRPQLHCERIHSISSSKTSWNLETSIYFETFTQIMTVLGSARNGAR